MGALEIEHYVYLSQGDKMQELLRILQAEAPESAIIFCNTRDDTQRVANELKRSGYNADWLNADLSQKEREAVMTFVLGLVKEPPASKYLYKPDARQQATLPGLAETEGGRGVDFVIEATGVPSAVAEGIDFARRGATYLVVGQYTDHGPTMINPHHITKKQLRVLGSWAFSAADQRRS